ncbi:MAG: tetratricopeptide repeat protein [Bacteroidales bacterium]|nr:tetratricopeptide repeat protein [Bacteroidales bacterium]
MKLFSWIIIFLFFSIETFSQSSLDSLNSILDKTKNKESKIDVLCQMSDEAAYISYDSAIYYKKAAIDLTNKSEDFEKITNLYLDLGKLHLYNGDYSKAVDVFKMAYEESLKTTSEKLQSLCIHNLGNAYLYLADYTSALENYLLALEIREKIGDSVGIAATTNNIGLIYWNLENYDEALTYYKKSLDQEIQLGNELGIGSSLNNVGLVFWQNEQFDSAIYYIRMSVIIREELGNSKQIASGYNNLGVLFRSMNNYDSSLYYFNKALVINKSTNIEFDIANVWNNIATVLYYQDKNSLAIKYLDSAIFISYKNNERELLKNAYKMMSNIYKDWQKFDSAFKYLNLYTIYKDSLFDENFSEQIADMETKYESDKKQKEIEIQNLAIEKKDTEISARKRTQTILVSFIVVVLLLMVFLVRLFLQKKKANELLSVKNVEISQQKEEIETQANNLHEAFEEIKKVNEELTVQKEEIDIKNKLLQEKNDIVESSIKYASTIQNASLPLQSKIDRFFDNFIIYYPKDIVSGDFYFFSEVNNEQTGKSNLFFIVSDCTGHGVPGAFMSMIGIRLLTKYINERKIESPAEILTMLENDVYTALKQDSTSNTDGMDLIICKFSDFENSDKFTLTYAGAKRDLSYYDTSKENITKISATRRSIGGNNPNNKEVFKNNELILSKNDTVFLYSDGLIDQNDISRKRFGSKKLNAILKENINKSLDEQKFEIEKELTLWQKDTYQRDDITFVALKLKF